MVMARMGVWGKGRQSLAPPQHTEPGARSALRISGDDFLAPDDQLDGIHLNG